MIWFHSLCIWCEPRSDNQDKPLVELAITRMRPSQGILASWQEMSTTNKCSGRPRMLPKNQSINKQSLKFRPSTSKNVPISTTIGGSSGKEFDFHCSEPAVTTTLLSRATQLYATRIWGQSQYKKETPLRSLSRRVPALGTKAARRLNYLFAFFWRWADRRFHREFMQYSA